MQIWTTLPDFDTNCAHNCISRCQIWYQRHISRSIWNATSRSEVRQQFQYQFGIYCKQFFLQVQNIDCVTSLDSAPDNSYDLVLMEFVEPCGKLNRDTIRKVPMLRKKLQLSNSDSRILPWKITIHCQLIQSDILNKVNIFAKMTKFEVKNLRLPVIN